MFLLQLMNVELQPYRAGLRMYRFFSSIDKCRITGPDLEGAGSNCSLLNLQCVVCIWTAERRWLQRVAQLGTIGPIGLRPALQNYSYDKHISSHYNNTGERCTSPIYIPKNTLKIPKRYVNRRRTNNVMGKRKDKSTNNDLQDTTQKTKDWRTLTPLKTGSEFKWSDPEG